MGSSCEHSEHHPPHLKAAATTLTLLVEGQSDGVGEAYRAAAEEMVADDAEPTGGEARRSDYRRGGSPASDDVPAERPCVGDEPPAPVGVVVSSEQADAEAKEKAELKAGKQLERILDQQQYLVALLGFALVRPHTAL